MLLWNPLIEGPGPLAEAAEEIDQGGREAAERLAAEGAALARSAGLEAEAAVAESHHGAGRTILHEADRREAALIVLGSHGLSPTGLGTARLRRRGRPPPRPPPGAGGSGAALAMTTNAQLRRLPHAGP